MSQQIIVLRFEFLILINQQDKVRGYELHYGYGLKA